MAHALRPLLLSRWPMSIHQSKSVAQHQSQGVRTPQGRGGNERDSLRAINVTIHHESVPKVERTVVQSVTFSVRHEHSGARGDHAVD